MAIISGRGRGGAGSGKVATRDLCTIDADDKLRGSKANGRRIDCRNKLANGKYNPIRTAIDGNY